MAQPKISLGPDVHSGRRLGKYEIICQLSEGGMSELFLAFQRGLAGFRKLVVLKRILPDIQGQEEFVRLFLDEAKITASFNHPNLAQVYDLDVADGELFLAMEFIQGASLLELARAFVEAEEPIPVGFSLAVARDVAVALHYAHTFTDPLGQQRQVVHRDVAEKNVMVSFEGATKLLDFGIAKQLGSQTTRTVVGMVRGTVGYMSPEQVRGETLDGRSDVFALGVMLHQLLTGNRLFWGETEEEEISAPLIKPAPRPSETNPEVSLMVDAAVLRSLEKDRERRYSSALEMARGIEQAGRDLIWPPERSAALVRRLFAGRLQQTRVLLQDLASPAVGEATPVSAIASRLSKFDDLARPAPPKQPPPSPITRRLEVSQEVTASGATFPEEAKTLPGTDLPKLQSESELVSVDVELKTVIDDKISQPPEPGFRSAVESQAVSVDMEEEGTEPGESRLAMPAGHRRTWTLALLCLALMGALAAAGFFLLRGP